MELCKRDDSATNGQLHCCKSSSFCRGSSKEMTGVLQLQRSGNPSCSADGWWLSADQHSSDCQFHLEPENKGTDPPLGNHGSFDLNYTVSSNLPVYSCAAGIELYSVLISSFLTLTQFQFNGFIACFGESCHIVIR